MRSPVDVYPPETGAVLVGHDVTVPSRDGTVLRVNVHRPSGSGPFPVLLCAHPYGKDNIPTKRKWGAAGSPA